ncbi:hypothetical protein AKJ47_02850 [candidate division MSBL1 archaeon SCGC-AAA261G05]|uniref:Uncharacterized protein n=2 Tax=candidate division MSBL1 TaxID=215777 RepID=A0A133V9J5_9EURY|nr:hypothetical protein AKJ47_02850 [candidate division MSBL1 archaeon SCGC-AAA261G05]KXB04463.1 hypothetical protein AKJ48_02490 [candidate division MSBL1 archaeon SCGC-AAA261O19]
MMGNIIVYRQPSSSKSRQLSRSLHGYVDKSNYGKYTYERDGLLDKIPYRKLIKGVFIVRERDLQKFVELLEKYQAEYNVRNVELTAEDEEILSSQKG